MNPMDFDALLTINQGFNTLNNLSESNAVQSMSQQALQSIQTMQTPMPQGHLPQHVVLPIFQNQQNQQQAASSTSSAAEQFFAVVNGAQKGPFTLEQIKGLAIADVIDENTQVWMPGLPSWVDLKTCLANLKK